MIGQLLSYGYVMCVSLAAGLCVLILLLGRERLLKLDWAAWWDVLVILGLCAFGGVIQIWSLWLPLGGWLPHLLGLLTMVGGGTAAWYLWRVKPHHGVGRIIFRVLVVLLAVLPWFAVTFGRGLMVASHYDSYLYHAQTVLWNEEFPVVPGLGNLHGRLAFDSSYFLLAAYFGVKMAAGVTLFPLNSFLTLMATLGAVGRGFRAWLRGQYIHVVWNCLLVILWYRFFDLFGSESNTSSPSPDLLAGLLVYYACLLALKASEEQWRDFSVLGMSLIGCFALTVKLSTIPIVVLPLYAFVLGPWRRWRVWCALGCMGVLVLGPWVARNVVLSGYAIYPVKATGWSHVDWKIPEKTVDELKASIIDDPLVGAGLARNSQEAHALHFRNWFPKWLAKVEPGRRYVIIWVLIAPLFILPVWLWRKNQRHLAWATLMGWGGTLFSLSSVPNESFRFSFGFVFTGAALAGGCALALCPRKLQPWLAGATGLGMMAIAWTVGHPLDALEDCRDQIVENRWMPDVQMRHFKTKLMPCVNFSVRQPDPEPGSGLPADWCGQEPLPCTPYHEPRLEMRGASLADGFRIHSEEPAK